MNKYKLKHCDMGRGCVPCNVKYVQDTSQIQNKRQTQTTQLPTIIICKMEEEMKEDGEGKERRKKQEKGRAKKEK
jgi:hypothetical protein